MLIRLEKLTENMVNVIRATMRDELGEGVKLYDNTAVFEMDNPEAYIAEVIIRRDENVSMNVLAKIRRKIAIQVKAQ